MYLPNTFSSKQRNSPIISPKNLRKKLDFFLPNKIKSTHKIIYKTLNFIYTYITQRNVY